MEHDIQLRGKTHSCDVTICFYFEPHKWFHKRGMPYSRYKIASTWQEQQMSTEWLMWLSLDDRTNFTGENQIHSNSTQYEELLETILPPLIELHLLKIGCWRMVENDLKHRRFCREGHDSIWAMKEYGDAKSWIKVFFIDHLKGRVSDFVGSKKNGEMFLLLGMES
ncbi:hypothetical protein NC652_020990 [Populus alba x Populus x berolinensis]|nr:hypothetical protein NC652_020990 [Populus alba x Populus x berolinensis]